MEVSDHERAVRTQRKPVCQEKRKGSMDKVRRERGSGRSCRYTWVGGDALSDRLVGQVLPQFPKLFAFRGVGLV